VQVIRRHIAFGAIVLALGGVLSSPLWTGFFTEIIFGADLLQPGPLGEQALGAENAPVTIIEYASMTCPHCANFAVNTFPALKDRYIDTGKVRFIFREYPLDALGAGAFSLARCMSKDKYFSFIETLFQQQREWVVPEPLEPLRTIARKFGFADDSVAACLADEQMSDGITWVRNRAAEKFKVQVAPTFFVNGRVYTGTMTLAEIERAIGRAPNHLPNAD
jgi:protein-disulfide isomerase